MAGLNFNAQQHEPQQAFENLPVGWYVAQMVESEMKPTASATGSYLECTFEVIAPQQFAGRKLWDRLNLNNPNEKAVEIANQTLSAICHAVNVMQVQDSQQLHHKPLEVKVGMNKPTEQYPEVRNEIKGYRACQAQTSPQPQQSNQWGGQQQQQQQQVQQQQQNNVQQGGQQWQQQQNNVQQNNVQQNNVQQNPNAGQQASWQNNTVQQQDPNMGQQQQQQQQQVQQEPVQQQNFQQNDQGQQAASQGKAPWQQ